MAGAGGPAAAGSSVHAEGDGDDDAMPDGVDALDALCVLMKETRADNAGVHGLW